MSPQDVMKPRAFGARAHPREAVPDYLLRRILWLGIDRATLTVPKAKAGETVEASLVWMPAPPTFLHITDVRTLRAACREIQSTARARWGVVVTFPPVPTGDPCV